MLEDSGFRVSVPETRSSERIVDAAREASVPMVGCARVTAGMPKPNHPLLGHPSVLLTPHVAFLTIEAVNELALDGSSGPIS